MPLFELDDLLRDLPSGPACRELCAALQTAHHAVVRLPAADAARMAGMWRAARGFFGLDLARKEAAGGGPFRRLPGVVGVAGYARMDDGNEFTAGPGDVTSLPSGHDAWVMGDEPVVVVDWYGASHYAQTS